MNVDQLRDIVAPMFDLETVSVTVGMVPCEDAFAIITGRNQIMHATICDEKTGERQRILFTPEATEEVVKEMVRETAVGLGLVEGPERPLSP